MQANESAMCGAHNTTNGMEENEAPFSFSALWKRFGLAGGVTNLQNAAIHNHAANSVLKQANGEHTVLTSILGDAYTALQQDAESKDTRFALLLEDLQQVLRIPNGAGLRVLRHWLDSANGFDQVFSPSVTIYAHAALTDYAKQRMVEIALADPESFLSIQLIAARAAGNGQFVQ